MEQLKFSSENKKLDKLAKEVKAKQGIYRNVYSMSIPSGRAETCPYADKCKAYVGSDGKLVSRDDYIDYRCYSASMEAVYKAQLKQREHYTKSLPFWVHRLDSINIGNFPNMELIASRGGTKDKLINVYGLREAIQVDTEKEAMDKGLEIDTTDYLACYGKESFALLIHGTQPKRINQRIKNKKTIDIKPKIV